MKYKIFVINLEQNPERLNYIKTQLSIMGLDCERIEAVYGANLSEEEVSSFYSQKSNKEKYFKSLSAGEIGCYLSHVKAWNEIINQGLDFAIILEDDVFLAPQFPKALDVLAELSNWDYIKLTGPVNGRKITNELPVKDGFSIARYNKIPITCFGQAVSIKGAKTLVKWFSDSKIARPIDVDIQHYWEMGIDVIGLEPGVVFCENKFESAIDKINNKRKTDRANLIGKLRFQYNFKVNAKKSGKKLPSLAYFIDK